MPPTWIYVNFADLAARPVGVTFELILFLVIRGSMLMDLFVIWGSMLMVFLLIFVSMSMVCFVIWGSTLMDVFNEFGVDVDGFIL